MVAMVSDMARNMRGSLGGDWKNSSNFGRIIRPARAARIEVVWRMYL